MLNTVNSDGDSSIDWYKVARLIAFGIQIVCVISQVAVMSMSPLLQRPTTVLVINALLAFISVIFAIVGWLKPILDGDVKSFKDLYDFSFKDNAGLKSFVKILSYAFMFVGRIFLVIYTRITSKVVHIDFSCFPNIGDMYCIYCDFVQRFPPKNIDLEGGGVTVNNSGPPVAMRGDEVLDEADKILPMATEGSCRNHLMVQGTVLSSQHAKLHISGFMHLGTTYSVEDYVLVNPVQFYGDRNRGLKGYVVCKILEITVEDVPQSSWDSTTVRVRRFFRAEDISEEKDNRSDIREVYYSYQTHSISAVSIMGKCKVTRRCDLPCEVLPIFDNVFFSEYFFNPSTGSLNLMERDMRSTLSYSSGAFKKNKAKGKVGCETYFVTLDIFAGCGGSSQLQSGISITKLAAESEETPNYAEDIDNLPLPRQVDFITGGPPCEGFSGFKGFADSDWEEIQSRMIKAFLTFAGHYRPRFLLLQTVRKFAFRQTLASLLEMGYQVRVTNLEQSSEVTFVWAATPDEILPEWPVLVTAINKVARRRRRRRCMLPPSSTRRCRL